MNDLENLKNMFEKANINYKIKDFEINTIVSTGRYEKREVTKENGEKFIWDWPINREEKIKYLTLTIEKGYNGFFTEFYFKENGTFYDIGAFE